MDDYERGRPNYSHEAVRWLIEGARTVVDLGAGTGKLTSSLVGLVAEVAAVEPQLSMVRRLSRVVAGARAVCGRAEEIPIRSKWADAVVVAQAFHWFDQKRAPAEIARVLKSGGRLGLVWNVRDGSVDWVAELSRITGRDNSQEIRSLLRSYPAFGEFERKMFRATQLLDRDTLVAHVRSRSHVAALDEGARRSMTNAVLELCDVHPDLSGRDRFELPYQTQAFRATKESAP